MDLSDWKASFEEVRMHALAASDQVVFACVMTFWFLLWLGMAILVTWGCKTAPGGQEEE